MFISSKIYQTKNTQKYIPMWKCVSIKHYSIISQLLFITRSKHSNTCKKPGQVSNQKKINIPISSFFYVSIRLSRIRLCEFYHPFQTVNFISLSKFCFFSSLTLCSHYCFLVFDEKKNGNISKYTITNGDITSSLCILQLKNVWFFLAYRRISVRDVMSEKEQRKMQTFCKQITVNRCHIWERGIIRILPRIQKVNKRSFGRSQFIRLGFLFLNLIAERNNTSLITFSW